MLRGFWTKGYQVADTAYLSNIDEIIDDARNGRMFILVDDEERENEGDLVIPAQMATPDAINFMAKHGRGLICLALTSQRVRQLDLPLMVRENETRHGTAFTVSIEARDGISTGISASDRARTVAAAIDPTKSDDAVVSPGHIFPLMAREGGTLVRAGHTEASVDIARLAGLNPAGVICEIMKDDGTMARMPNLIAVAQLHGLKIATIADLIAYRLKNDRIVTPSVETTLQSANAGEFRAVVYENTAEFSEHLALVKGDPRADGPIMVRVHQFSIFDAVESPERYSELHESMRMIDAEGRGVIVMIRDPSSTIMSDRIKAQLSSAEQSPPPLRNYGIGAQILLDLGVHEMILLSNTERAIVGLQGYDLKVVERRPIVISGPDEAPAQVRAHGR